jgi:hypothetical protein
MIIDADTHISPTGEDAMAITYGGLLRRMDRAGTATSRSDSGLWLGGSPPGWEGSKDDVRRCVYDYGFCGVKLNGAQNSYYIDDPKLSLPLVEEIAKTGRLLAFHVGTDAYEATHPFRVARWPRCFPS